MLEKLFGFALKRALFAPPGFLKIECALKPYRFLLRFWQSLLGIARPGPGDTSGDT